MSLLHADNFQVYGTDIGALTDGVYAQVGDSTGGSAQITLGNDPDPLIGSAGKAVRFTNGSSISGLLRHVYRQGGQTTIGIGFRIWMPDLPADDEKAPAISLRDTSNDSQCQLFVNTDGTLSFYRGGTVTSGGAGISGTSKGTLIASSTLPVLTANAWHHVELKVAIHDTTGTVDIRVNEANVAGLYGLTGLDTKGTSNSTTTQVVAGMSVASGGSSDSWYIKDFWEWNTSGSVNNDFIGAKGVYWLQPDGDSSLNWDVSTGATGYDLIDEAGPSESDYISADDTPPSASEFTMEDLPSEITAVYGVMTMARMWKVDSGDATVQIGLKGTAEDDGDDRTISTAATYWMDISEVSPDTAAAWTPAEINAVLMTTDRTT